MSEEQGRTHHPAEEQDDDAEEEAQVSQRYRPASVCREPEYGEVEGG